MIRSMVPSPLELIESDHRIAIAPLVATHPRPIPRSRTFPPGKGLQHQPAAFLEQRGQHSISEQPRAPINIPTLLRIGRIRKNQPERHPRGLTPAPAQPALHRRLLHYPTRQPRLLQIPPDHFRSNPVGFNENDTRSPAAQTLQPVRSTARKEIEHRRPFHKVQSENRKHSLPHPVGGRPQGCLRHSNGNPAGAARNNAHAPRIGRSFPARKPADGPTHHPGCLRVILSQY